MHLPARKAVLCHFLAYPKNKSPQLALLECKRPANPS